MRVLVLVLVVASVGCGGWKQRGERVERPRPKPRPGWLERGVTILGKVIFDDERTTPAVKTEAAPPELESDTDLFRPRVSTGMVTGVLCSSELCRRQYGALLIGMGIVTSPGGRTYHWADADIQVGLRELCAGYHCGGELPMTGALHSGIGVRADRLRFEVGAGIIWSGRAHGERVLGISALGGRIGAGIDVLRWRGGSLTVLAEHQGALLPFGGVHATGVSVRVAHAVF